MVRKAILPMVLVTGLFAACSAGGGGRDEAALCHVGSYRLDGGAVIDLAPVEGATLRWRTIDGRSGTLQEGEDGVWSGQAGWSAEAGRAAFILGDCDDATIAVTGIDGVSGTGRRIEYTVRETRFQGEGEELAGRLILPPGEGPFPLVVLVHGSEGHSALTYAYYQRILPAQGVASFVYDKRGTGASTGRYTQDFHLLAADAVAALREARRLAGPHASATGFLGGSQGGWVAPLAATMGNPDFVMVGFGLAEGPLAEDREEVFNELREAGYDGEALVAAREITDVTGQVMASGFTEGREALAELRERYRDRPWFGVIEGEYTGDMLNGPLWRVQMRYAMMDVGTSWEYQPVPVLRRIGVPMLWVLAGADREAPSGTTRAILTGLQTEGRQIDVAFFPDVDHGMTRFVETDDGGRVMMGYADGYFRLLADWPRRYGFSGCYGDAELTPRRQAEAEQ